ncbi:unnamed protein product [Phaedon cochleariae]|uniref:HAT C-terminal dimerisation domain-containing protein n=1 Tax=Phaedon cochleariae TaxID=80249 RepID=A0A9N9SEQ1_PHACE|nr:unnamed protein product [Phaedon cochleariae]
MERKHPLVDVGAVEKKHTKIAAAASSATSEMTTGSTDIPEAPPIKKNKVSVQTELNMPKKIGVVAKNKIDRQLMKLFFKDYQPFGIVEDEGFREFVNILNPNYSIPTRKTLTHTLLPAMFEETLNNVKSLLKDVRSVTLTTDHWTSINTESFIAVTIHYIEENNFQLKSVLLECSATSQAHTSVNIARELNNIVVTWGIENKIMLAVTDNAANIRKAIRDELKWKHFGCFAHTINLIAEDCIVLVDDLVKKVRDLVSHFKRSTKSTIKLNEIQIQMGKTPKKLIQDVRTRWNSTFYMIERFLELEEPVRSTMALLDSDKLPVIVVEEWKMLADIKKVLEPLEAVTNIMSGQNYVTLSSVIVLTKGLESILKEMETQDFALVQTMVNAMLQSIKDRLGDLESSNTLLISTFLDPRFKNVAFSSDIVAERSKKLVINLVTQKVTESGEVMKQAQENILKPSNENKNAPSENYPSKKSIWSHFDKKIAGLQPSGTSMSRAIIEVQRYLEDGLLERDKDPLTWWRQHAYNYPFLSKIVIEKMGSVATSVPSERIFSKMGQILTERRSRLTSDKVSKLVFMNVNV